jgi:hypothetical protein
MRVRAKTVLATVLVTFAVLSNLLLVQSLLASAGAEVRGPPESFDWETFLVPQFGTTVDYPAGVFSLPDGKADIGVASHAPRSIPSELRNPFSRSPRPPRG